jgi:peptidylamidoglycolate lyase
MTSGAGGPWTASRSPVTMKAMPSPITNRRRLLLAASAIVTAGRRTVAHEIDRSWPAGRIVQAQVSGVAVDPRGRVLVLNRGENHWMPQGAFKRQKTTQPAVLVVDPESGKVEVTWGASTFIMPHQIVVGPEGNVWVVDVGLHQAIEFDVDGKKLRVVGGPKVRFNMPTDMAILSDGSFVVSDGYLNSRVVKFSPDGKMVAAWGTKGSRPLQFNVPHSVAVDDRDRIYVADRENDRIQVLDAEGRFLAEWTDVDRPITVRVSGGSLFVLSNLDADRGIVRRLNLEGKLLDSFPTKPAGTTEDFEWPHGIGGGCRWAGHLRRLYAHWPTGAAVSGKVRGRGAALVIAKGSFGAVFPVFPIRTKVDRRFSKLVGMPEPVQSPVVATPPEEWACTNGHALAVIDRFPVSLGHDLVITKRMAPTLYECPANDPGMLMTLDAKGRRLFGERSESRLDGYHVGFNCGSAPGQTLPHVSVHLIPRYPDDNAESRGILGHVIREQENYFARWNTNSRIAGRQS